LDALNTLRTLCPICTSSTSSTIGPRNTLLAISPRRALRSYQRRQPLLLRP
jgi:hypothetical protein